LATQQRQATVKLRFFNTIFQSHDFSIRFTPRRAGPAEMNARIAI
jgi:hypothetical protein